MSPRSLRSDDGSLTVFVAVIVAGLLVAFGLVVDGGQQLAATERADSIAQQAARAGAQALDAQALRASGLAQLDPSAAVAAADAYLSAAGVPGAAHADASTVTVDVTIHRATDVLSVIGIQTLTAHGHARARIAPGVTTDEAGP
jgi:hypothetical protein